MPLLEELHADVRKIFSDKWQIVSGQQIPDTESLRLGNHGTRISATVLYADLAESTSLVNSNAAEFAGEVYKAYLNCAVKIIRANGGNVVSFDGDRVMGVFHGKAKNTAAARCALQVSGAVKLVVNPALMEQYPKKNISIVAACGVDTGELMVARTGIRNNNDLVWIGRAANYAAKLCSLRQDGYSSWITGRVFDAMNSTSKIGGSEKKQMWEERSWRKYDLRVYRSNWTWRP